MCFSLLWLRDVFIWLIAIGAIIALIRLLLPLVLGWLGAAGGVIQQALEIILWAFVAIMVVIFVFQLIGCLLGTGVHFPTLR